MKQNKLIALFFISVASISYELFVMRIFSVGGWSNFGSLVISAALLGIGLSGILITFFDAWVTKHTGAILSVCALILPLLMAGATIIAQMVPFNPEFLASDSRQLWFIGAYYIIYGVPFFATAVYTGVSFIALRKEIQKVYFCNMIGSGVGGFFIILFMFILPPRYLILPILALTVAAALFSLAERDEKTFSIRFKLIPLVALTLITLSSVFFTLFWGDIRISDYKAISYVRKYPDPKLVHHSYGPGGEYHVYASQYFHFAPGLSDNAALLPDMPTQLYWGLFVDGSGPIGVMGSLGENQQAYMDYLPMAAPYTMLNRPDVLLVNLSGGINAQVARYKGANRIDIVEPSTEMIHLLRDDPNLVRFTGDLLRSDRINVIQGEGRSYCTDHEGAYDLVEISLVDSIGLSDSGGYAVHEDFKYTVEAFKEYFASLKPNGVLSVTVWDKLNPPRNVLKLLNTIITAMDEAGFAAPEQSLYSFGLFMSTSTILVKNGAFTRGEIAGLNDFVRTRSFEALYVPDTELPQRDINILMGAYSSHFDSHQAEAVVESFTNADMYRAAIPQFFAGNSAAIEKQYIFDIRPITDERPYYSGFLKLRNLPMYLDQMRDISEEWGYLLLLGMLVQACLFGFIVIIIPIIGRRKELFQNRTRGTIGVILYYAGLGLAYMLIEIYLIQRLGAFLSNPTYSASIVITVMLIFSALGNLASGVFKKFRSFIVPGACVLIAGGLLFYIYGLDDFLARYQTANLLVRILASSAIIAPVAFFMGMPYPNGLDSLQENKPQLMPWAWGMNGGLSVAGSALARILSVSSGFPVLLGVGIVTYLMVGCLYRVNLARH